VNHNFDLSPEKQSKGFSLESAIAQSRNIDKKYSLSVRHD